MMTSLTTSSDRRARGKARTPLYYLDDFGIWRSLWVELCWARFVLAFICSACREYGVLEVVIAHGAGAAIGT